MIEKREKVRENNRRKREKRIERLTDIERNEKRDRHRI